MAQSLGGGKGSLPGSPHLTIFVATTCRPVATVSCNPYPDEGHPMGRRDDLLPRPTSARYVFLVYAASLSLILYLDRICIAESAGSISEELGLSDVQRGWMFTAFTLG